METLHCPSDGKSLMHIRIRKDSLSRCFHLAERESFCFIHLDVVILPILSPQLSKLPQPTAQVPNSQYLKEKACLEMAYSPMSISSPFQCQKHNSGNHSQQIHNRKKAGHFTVPSKTFPQIPIPSPMRFYMYPRTY